ncbi:MAG: hypothetical protein V2J26_10465 [Pacificimonas sp.]|jgi:hypothetical protein|nr:hypothetical protein [Pacificimonas sp.]
MIMFRTFLIVSWLTLAGYTALVVVDHGFNLLPVFFGDMAAMAWPGQFNLDFLLFLCLSAFWTAWRNGFSAGGLALSVLAFFGGYGFLAPYLLYLSMREPDAAAILAGVNRRTTAA